MNPSTEISPKNIVLLLEDDEKIIKPFIAYFEAKKLDAELIVSKNLNDYLLAFEKHSKQVKCMVMDLNNHESASETSINETIIQIKKHHNNHRVPIFVHSGNLAHFTDLNEKGTIIKKEKNRKSIEEIIDSIELMLNSGFLNIFSINGTLDEKIMSEIHSAFINQFKHNEIEEIIKSIYKVNPNKPDFSNRINEVFERIAIRSIYQNFINSSDEKNNVVNSIEHYFRRTNTIKHFFYTGDVFEDKDGKMYFVATPRCDISNKKFEKILLCEINQIEEQHGFSSKNAEKNIQSCITDNVTNSNIAERYRFLPPSPQFKGGFVDFRKITTLSEDELKEFILIISLVDDLTNDVIRKLASYLLRGGISDTAYNEALYYIQKEVVAI